MGLLDFVRGTQPEALSDLMETKIENTQLRGELSSLEHRFEELEESFLAVADAFDNVGWSTGLSQDESKEMSLGTVKNIALAARAMTAVNPFVKRGVDARISYIWGDGLDFDGLSESGKAIMKKNRDQIFSQQAFEERERAAATDGNVFVALHREDTSTFRVPFSQITGSVSNPDNPEEVWYYKREWKTSRKNGTTEAVKETDNKKFYPSLRYAMQLKDEGRELPKRWGDTGVEQNYVMQHDAVNKQIGWRWGLPDVMAVMFFAKVYKEYLEDNVTLVKAYSRIAMQYKSPSQGAANASSVQLQRTPARDPITGESRDIGGTAVTGTGFDIEPIGLNAGSVDFSNGEPLAAAIASGLGVSVDVILSKSGNSGADSTLDLPTLKTMQTRRALWTNTFADMFEFWDENDLKITWGDIEQDETHRRVQSVQLAYDGGQLFQDESRAETLKTLGIVPSDKHGDDELPVAPAIVAAEKAAENAEKVAAAKPSVVPGQGRSGSVGSVNSGRGQVKAAAKKAMVR